MVKVNNTELIARVATKMGITKVQAKENLNAVKEVLLEAATAKEEVTWFGMLSLTTSLRAAKSGTVNGTPYSTPEKRVVSLKALKELKDATEAGR